MRQDDAAAHRRRAGNAGQGHDRAGRPRRLAAAGDEARLRHRVPVVCAVSQSYDPRQRRLWPRQPAAGPRAHRGARKGVADAGRIARFGRQVPGPDVRRPAAAHRPRARTCRRPWPIAARRAAVGARRHRARAAAWRDSRVAAAAGRDDDHGHARPGRGVVGGRPDRRDEFRPHRAGRHAARDLRRAGHAVRRRLRRQDQRAARGRRRRRPVPRRHGVARRRLPGRRRGDRGQALPAPRGNRAERERRRRPATRWMPRSRASSSWARSA